MPLPLPLLWLLWTLPVGSDGPAEAAAVRPGRESWPLVRARPAAAESIGGGPIGGAWRDGDLLRGAPAAAARELTGDWSTGPCHTAQGPVDTRQP